MTAKRPDHTIARPNAAARVSGIHEEFLAIVRELAKRIAREDHAAEIALRAQALAVKS